MSVRGVGRAVRVFVCAVVCAFAMGYLIGAGIAYRAGIGR